MPAVMIQLASSKITIMPDQLMICPAVPNQLGERPHSKRRFLFTRLQAGKRVKLYCTSKVSKLLAFYSSRVCTEASLELRFVNFQQYIRRGTLINIKPIKESKNVIVCKRRQEPKVPPIVIVQALAT